MSYCHCVLVSQALFLLFVAIPFFTMRLIPFFLVLFLLFVSSSLPLVNAITADVKVTIHLDSHRSAPFQRLRELTPSADLDSASVIDDKTPKTANVQVDSYGKTSSLGHFKVVPRTDKTGQIIIDKASGKPLRYLIPLKPAVDPVFRPLVRMPDGGLNPNEYVDTHNSYSGQLLTEQQCKERNIPFNQGDLVFANLLHENQFWIARLQPNSVQEVRGLSSIFKSVGPIPLVGHQMGRYLLKPGRELELYPQTPGQKKPLVDRLNDFLSSNEGAYTVDEDSFNVVGYDPVNAGLRDGFLMVHKFYSFPQYAYMRTAIKALGEKMIESRIDGLSDQEKNAIVVQAIRLADERGMKYFYNTLKNSCSTTFFFDTLDFVLSKTRPEKENLWSQIKSRVFGRVGRNPAWMRLYLDYRHLPHTELHSFLNDVKRVSKNFNQWPEMKAQL
jgi:hypothetical protein